jgi:hypothetical protein
MPTLKAAHIRENGQDMIIFPLDNSFGRKTDREQSLAIQDLERRAHLAGLAGHAVAFWDDSSGTRFRGPSRWHPYLRGLSMSDVLANVNKQISW